MSSIRGMDDRDIIAWGAFQGLLMWMKERRDDFDFDIFMEEDGYFAKYVDIHVLERSFRLTITAQSDIENDLLKLRDDLA